MLIHYLSLILDNKGLEKMPNFSLVIALVYIRSALQGNSIWSVR